MIVSSPTSLPVPGKDVKLQSLPIIDISPFLNKEDSHGRLSTAAKLHAACLEYGFFYLDIRSFVDPSEPEELTRLAKEFFDLSDEEKTKISLKHQDYARGECEVSSIGER